MEQSDLVGHALSLWRPITGLGITQICGWGSIYYSLGALSESIIAERGFSKPLVFGAFSAALLLSGLVSRPIGRWLDRAGGRPVMCAGSLVAAAGCVLLAAGTTPAVYVMGWLVLGVAMRMALYDAAFASLAQLAGPRARQAISYLSLYGGLASTVFWPLSIYLVRHVGLANTYLIFAAMQLLICLPLHYLLLGHGETARPDHPAPAETTSSYLTGRERNVALALFAMVLSFNGFVFSSLSAHIVPLFEKLGFAATAGVTLAAIIGPSQVASRLAQILFGKNSLAVTVGNVACALLTAAFLILWAGHYSWMAAVAFCVFYGLSNGLVTIMKGVVPLALFGPQGFGLLLGTLATPNLILTAVAPMVFSIIIDSVGATSALWFCFVLSLFPLAAMAYLSRLHPR